MVQNLTRRVEKLGIPVWVWGMAVLLVLALMNFRMSDFQRLLWSQMLIVGIFALSLNLIMGYGGMVHFGHAAFYGAGAYTVAILVTRYDLSPVLAMVAAPFASALLAVVIGWFCVRRVRLYFAILTLAFGQLVYVIVHQAYAFTGGDNGIHGIPVPKAIAAPSNFLFFTLIIFALSLVALRQITRSPFVLTLRAIRENPERAEFIGVNVRWHQLLTFVIGAFFAGLAGAMMCLMNRFVSPEMLFWTTSAEPILASLLGGMFTLVGPAIGAALLLFINISISEYQFWPMVLGTLTIFAVLTAPTGLTGLAQRLVGQTPVEG